MKKIEIGRSAVLGALKSRAPRAMHLMEVVGELNLPKSRRDDVRDKLDELAGLGMAREMPGNRFRIATEGRVPRKTNNRKAPSGKTGERAPKHEAELVGWLSIHPRGFSFVAAEDGGEDVFIPPTGRLNAMHGDRVRVGHRPSARGREGEVLEVITRGVGRVSGVFEKQRKTMWLTTSDPRLPPRIEVVGTVPLGIEPGTEVVAAIESYPSVPGTKTSRRSASDGDDMTARILSALGPRGSAQVEIEKIKIREGIEEEFTADVLEEAQSFGTRVSKQEIARREDLRDLDLCTIDPPTARDHDDAVWAEKLDDGGYRVVVAIADVSFYVKSDGALDKAALSRATSIYLPDRVIPMLPHELSSNLASLIPDEDRLTMAVEVILGPKGAIRGHRFIEGVMRSRARLSYNGVARALGLTDQGEAQPDAEARLDLLNTLYEVSQALRAKREKRGSLDFDLPEAKIILGNDSEPIDIQRSRTDPGLKKTYGMIEDLMLLANEVVAADLDRRSIPAIYRVHGKPDEDKIAVFRELAISLGYRLDEDAAEKPKKLARFLRGLSDEGHSKSLSSLLLRAMQQAVYDTKNIGHFALAAKNYLHFTSPIRRYPDLAVHRIIRALIHEDRVDKRALADTLRAQAATSSRRERRAMLVDREATNLYRAILMKDRVGETFDATISGVNDHGLYVAFDEPFVEARCPIEALGNDWYELDAMGMRLVGRRSGHSFAVSDRVRVEIESVSIEQREISIRLESDRPEARRIPRLRRGNSPTKKTKSAGGRRRETTRGDGKKTSSRPKRGAKKRATKKRATKKRTDTKRR